MQAARAEERADTQGQNCPGRGLRDGLDRDKQGPAHVVASAQVAIQIELLHAPVISSPYDRVEIGASVTERNLLFARPQVLDATRVRENWFLVSPSMARHFQSEGGGVNGQFSPASGSLAGRFLRCGTQNVECWAWNGAPWWRSERRMAVARQTPPIAQGA
jgi:hypothetical protein